MHYKLQPNWSLSFLYLFLKRIFLIAQDSSKSPCLSCSKTVGIYMKNNVCETITSYIEAFLRPKAIYKLKILAISSVNFGWIMEQNIFHQICKMASKCPKSLLGRTLPVCVSKYCNHGLAFPMKWIILTSFPNLKIHIWKLF